MVDFSTRYIKTVLIICVQQDKHTIIRRTIYTAHTRIINLYINFSVYTKLNNRYRNSDLKVRSLRLIRKDGSRLIIVLNLKV